LNSALDGALGHTVLRILLENGYTNVFNIAGGFASIRWF